MVLAEPWRDHDGTGRVVTDRAHVSMAFVDPDRWGQGLGTGLLAGLHQEARRRGWTTTSLWTRASNHWAHRLYLGAGYRLSGHTGQLPTAEPVVEFQQESLAREESGTASAHAGRPSATGTGRHEAGWHSSALG